MLNIFSNGAMDTRIGLDYIVENKEYVIKLGTALDTTNATVKKQVFELLSALCNYNVEGYARALETLDYYKVSIKRFILLNFRSRTNHKKERTIDGRLTYSR